MSAPALAATATGGERVLVVDDEPDIVALVVYHLAKAGYRVSSAAAGPDALTIARREHPALIVLDLMLPGMSGFEVLEDLQRDDATRGIAVMMLTARKEEVDRIRGLSLGADDYLTKPFSPQELVLRVGAILRARERDAGRGGHAHQRPDQDRPLGASRVGERKRNRGFTATEFRLLRAARRAERGRTLGRTHLPWRP